MNVHFHKYNASFTAPDHGFSLRLMTEALWRSSRHFSLLNVNAAGACGYDFLCDGGRLVRAYVRLRRGAI